MPATNSPSKTKPPSPPRLRSTDLPDFDDGVHVEPEPFLSGHPILPEDMDISDFSEAQLYEMNQKFLNEIGDNRPLISEPEHISELKKEYENNDGSPSFGQQIDQLINQGYDVLIRTRGDGSLALAFAYINRLRKTQIRPELDSCQDLLQNAQYEDIVTKEPYLIFDDLIRTACEQPPIQFDELLSAFQQNETAADLQAFLWNAENDGPPSVDGFCTQFVEAMDKEADDVQINALSRAMKVHLQIAYLSGRKGDNLTFVDLNYAEPMAESKAEPLVLLYRPGHYDILEKEIEG
ncbi:peptidase C65 Otubain-domain-containing protein [Phlebopus sp. FC_14]|nr:peptidase C65 Otubain-domain-containing protein [Phlebopus sp. FC_14]